MRLNDGSSMWVMVYFDHRAEDPPRSQYQCVLRTWKYELTQNVANSRVKLKQRWMKQLRARFLVNNNQLCDEDFKPL
jgi:hypothetical protein